VFVISFDLSSVTTDHHHPQGSRQAYRDIEATLQNYGFKRVQWSVYAAQTEDLANLFKAVDALKKMPWFGPSVKNLRAFRMEQGSDFTGIVKGM
jgi:CRISPR-associated endonuclease Cas2